MNEEHQRLCPSPEWAEYLQTEILTRLCVDVDLGPEPLELGPGPGAATDWLRTRVARLVAVEIEAEAAEALRKRFAGTNVEIVDGDATALAYADASFDTVAAFTMLHHIPTQAGQNALLAEAFRVLRPGGALLAADSLPSTSLHDFHCDDTYNPVDPAGLVARLQAIGYGRMVVDVADRWMVRAHKPAPGERIR